jgi:hypothetical protein
VSDGHIRKSQRSLRSRPAILFISHIRDEAREDTCPVPSRRLRDSRNAFAKRPCCASRIISSRRCFHTCNSIISRLSDLPASSSACTVTAPRSAAELKSWLSQPYRHDSSIRGPTPRKARKNGTAGRPSRATILRHPTEGSSLRLSRGRVTSRYQPPENRQRYPASYG